MATIYAEATLAIKTRRVDKDGTIHGGPAYYITTAFKGGFGKFLASFFAVAITLALGFMGCMVQSNSIGSAFQTAFGVPSQFVGVVLVIFCGFIFLGGVNRLAAVTEKVVPVMAVIFLVGAVGILVVRIARMSPPPLPSSSSMPSSPRPSSAAPSAMPSRPPSARVPSAACSPTRPVWADRPTPTPRPM